MQGKRWSGLVILAGVAALATWWLWPETAPEPGVVQVVLPALPSPAAIPVATPNTHARDLAGTWSLRDNGGDARAACDLFSAVTYLPGGQYFSNSETGRYATYAASVTFSGKIIIDIDAGEDRSQFDARETLPLAWTADHAVRIGKRQLYRCEKRES